jgi:hypothetical protein
MAYGVILCEPSSRRKPSRFEVSCCSTFLVYARARTEAEEREMLNAFEISKARGGEGWSSRYADY